MPRARNPQANRSDLRTPRAAPRTTAPNQSYGKQTAQEQSMKIQPLTPPGASAPGGSPPPPPTAPATAGGQAPAPISVTPLSAPTERPGVPVTNGLPTGPGPGPEALTGFAAMGAQQVADGGSVRGLLRSLAAQPEASSVIRQLAARA